MKALLLLAFLARGMIPAGFMPDVKTSGLFPLVVCSGIGSTTTVYVTADKIPDLPDDPQRHDDAPRHAPCVFASGFADGVPPPAPVLALFIPITSRELPTQGVILGGINFKPYLSQGPPALLLHT